MDPRSLDGMAALMQMLGDQRTGQIEQVLKPRGKIAQSPNNRPRYNIMDDPNYRPFGNYGAVSTDGKPMGSWRDEQTAPVGKLLPPDYAGAQQQQQGGGLLGMLSALVSGGQQQGPRINKLTGMPFGTLPGDPAYTGTAGAPQASPMAPAANAQARPPLDPQVQNLVDLASIQRDYKAANPSVMQPINYFGAQPVVDAGNQSFDPGTPPGLLGFTPQQGKPKVAMAAQPTAPKPATKSAKPKRSVAGKDYNPATDPWTRPRENASALLDWMKQTFPGAFPKY